MAKERIKKIIWSLMAVAIFVMFGLVVTRTFDASEAEQALGEAYDLADGWIVTDEDGKTSEQVSLPLDISPKEASGMTIANNLSREYAGLAFSIHADNASIRAYIDGTLVHEDGAARQLPCGGPGQGGAHVPRADESICQVHLLAPPCALTGLPRSILS